MLWLKQSTAITKRIGPFLGTDGITEVTNIITENTRISKAGGAFAAGPSLGSHDEDGWYQISFTADHTDTLGLLEVKIQDPATHLPVWERYMVLPANVYNSLVLGSDKLDSNAAEIGGASQTGLDLAVNWTAARAAKLDNIPSGTMPTQAEVLAIQNNTRIRVVVPSNIERPDVGSTTYRIWIYCYDDVGNMEAMDSLPTITAQNNTGTDRSANLSAVSNPSTGVYYTDYTVASDHAIEGLLFEWTTVEGGVTRKHGGGSLVVDTTAVDFTAADRTNLTTLATDYTTQRAALLDNLNATVASRASQASVDALPQNKTGYSLAATGLDAIPVTAPAGVATTFSAMVVQLWRRFFKKVTMTSTQLKTYADDGGTVTTTQTLSDDEVTQTQGAAT